MDTVKTVVEIISAILGIIVLLGAAGALLNQSKISQSLLTHGEKERQKLLEGVVFTLMFALIAFFLD